MNKTVTATGMEIKATVPMQLLISDDNSTWGNTMTFASKVATAAEVVPVTVYSMTAGETLTPTFYKMTDEGMKLVNDLGQNGLTYTSANIATIQVDDNTTGTEPLAFATTTVDYYADDVYLKLSGSLDATAANNNVSAKARVTNADTAGDPLDIITNALHLVIVDQDNKVLINQDLGTTNATIAVDSGKTYKEFDLGVLFQFVAANKDSQKLTVYAFYYGEDANCFNNNAISVDGLSIDIEFSLPTT